MKANDKETLPMPTTFDIASVSSIIPYVGRLEQIEDCGLKVDGEPTFSVDASKGKITFSGKNNKMVVTVGNTDSLAGKSQADKVFDYTMCILAYMYKFGKVGNEKTITVRYPLQNLVDNGTYKDVRSARRGVIKAMESLQSVMITGSTRVNKRKRNIGTNLFAGYSIEKGIVEIVMGPYIDWRAESKEYAPSMAGMFKLGNRPYRLVKALLRVTRINCHTDWFKESFRFVAIKSGVTIDYHSPKRTKEEILRTISDAKEGYECFGIKVVESDSKNLDEWLNESCIVVKPRGELLDEIGKIKRSRAKKVEERGDH